MRQKQINSWKEKNVELWEKIASTYLAIKNSPSAKLVFKIIFSILKIIFSMIIKKFFSNFLPEF